MTNLPHPPVTLELLTEGTRQTKYPHKLYFHRTFTFFKSILQMHLDCINLWIGYFKMHKEKK